jgi:hypothetical protein
VDWIQCSDKLPETDKSVIMFVHNDNYEYTNITIGYLEREDYLYNRPQQWTSFEDHFDMKDVSHWMPLPKPPTLNRRPNDMDSDIQTY